MQTLRPVILVLTAALLASCAALPVKEYNLATELKGKVQKYDLSGYAPDESKKSDAFYNEGVSNYNKDNGKAKTSLDAAITNYQIVIEKGFPLKISGVSAEAESNKSKALSIKADKYLEKEFKNADELYQQALQERSSKNYESALDKLESAKTGFLKIYQQAKEKRDSGSALIQEVQKKLDAVDKEVQAVQSEKANSEKIENSLGSGSKTNN